jgi:hypothetical protein
VKNSHIDFDGQEWGIFAILELNAMSFIKCQSLILSSFGRANFVSGQVTGARLPG